MDWYFDGGYIALSILGFIVSFIVVSWWYR